MKSRRLLFVLIVLAAWWSNVGCTNPTYTYYSINPCSNEIKDTVSYHKNNIYAVQLNLTLCNISEEAQTIGLRIISWIDANTSSDQAEAPVVFITRQTRERTTGVVSWNVPFDPQGHLNQVNHTMCPINVTDLLDSGENETQSLLYIDVSTSSIHPVQYNLKVEIVPHFVISLNESVSTQVAYYSLNESVVAAAAPQIYYFKFPSDVEAVTVDAHTESDICVFVSVQRNLCPVNDLPVNDLLKKLVRYRGIFQSMSKSAFLTVKKSVLGDEIVLVFITVDDSYCHSSPLLNMQLPNSTEEILFKQNITFVIRKQEPISKFIFAIFFPFIIFVIYLLVIVSYCLYSLCLPHMYFRISRKDKFKVFLDPSWSPIKWRECCEKLLKCCKKCNSSENKHKSSGYESINEDGDGSAGEGKVNEGGDGSADEGKVDEDEKKLMLPYIYKVEDQKLYRHRNYGWNTVTVGIFYALPALQLILSEQYNMDLSGDQDKCYYNFKCVHPWGVLTAFNNVWSNIEYVLLGLLFIIITWIKKCKYLKRDKNYTDSHGIRPFFSIYFAMGNGLILEGFMSAFYHICPTQFNFQFDTAFMFIIGGLLIVRVIQYRYPMFNSEAAIAFLSFGVIILFTLLGIYYDWRKPVPVRVALFIIVILLIFVFFTSYYRFHQWSCKSLLKSTIPEIKKYFLSCPKHKFRAFKLFSHFLLNLAWVLYAVIGYKGIDIATAVLALFITNLVLFLLFYVSQKIYFGETFTILPLLLLLCMAVLWGFSLHFKGKTPTNWEHTTPAESREKNHDCALLGFYDYHDIWHLLSANAMFVTFLFLLTLDDGIMETDSKDIHIF